MSTEVSATLDTEKVLKVADQLISELAYKAVTVNAKGRTVTLNVDKLDPLVALYKKVFRKRLGLLVDAKVPTT